MSQPGMSKYASQRGPYGWEPVETQVKFWMNDVAYETRMLAQAKAAGDTRLVDRAQRHLKEANAKLAAIGTGNGRGTNAGDGL